MLPQAGLNPDAGSISYDMGVWVLARKRSAGLFLPDAVAAVTAFWKGTGTSEI